MIKDMCYEGKMKSLYYHYINQCVVALEALTLMYLMRGIHLKGVEPHL